MSKIPKTLSVAITNYNEARTIGSTLESVLSQSCRPLEVIVVDDASTDASVDIVQQFVRRDPIVRLVRHERNLGTNATTNHGLRLCRGDYYFGTAADEVVAPGLLEKSMALLARHPQAAFCYAPTIVIDEVTGRSSVYPPRGPSASPCYLTPADLMRRLPEGRTAANTMVVRRDALLQMGGWPGEMRALSDWFGPLVLGFRYGLCYIPETLGVFHYTASSYSRVAWLRWSDQCVVIDRLFHLLKSPAYRDVLPYFQHSEAMCMIGAKVLRMVATHPEHWDLASALLCIQPVRGWLRRRWGLRRESGEQSPADRRDDK